ncbi:MAG TPA: hypothetical protein VH142_02280 [Polyangiaceae bacterium]|jgi:hypothetical protein|nr:hypothetical protein [Polyangiaceae bacterium]
MTTTHIARWDLDKTYLRTEFDTLRDLVKTALERPDEKRTNPGASTLLREMVRAGTRVHILSGSPEQMRKRLEDKLRLDGIVWDTFTLKPNLQNVLRLRFRAVKDQLGYKLPALLRSRAALEGKEIPHESLFGDDAEADAFVYSLYADVVAGRVGERELLEVCHKGRVYEDVAEELVAFALRIEKHDAVERIFIHLERQTPPTDFRLYGSRLVPFYNYLQSAFVLFEDARVPAEAVLRVAVELVVMHRFDGDALARSYLDLAKRGHLRGERIDDLASALGAWMDRESVPSSAELKRMMERLPPYAVIAKNEHGTLEKTTPDYLGIVGKHNPRRG